MPQPPSALSERRRLQFVSISLVGGGAEKILVRLLRALDPARYDLRLALFESKLDYMPEIPGHVRVECFEKTSRWDFFRLPAWLRGILRRGRPDAVVSLLDYANLVTVLAASGLRPRPRVIVCEHNYSPRAFVGWNLGSLVQAAKGPAYRRADHVVVVSQGIASMLRRRLRLAPERLRVIYNPIEWRAVSEQGGEPVGHAWLNDPNLPVVLTAGRLERVKRHDRLLRAFARARRRRPDLRLVILGKGSREGALRALARLLAIEPYVDFVGFQANPYAWIAKAAVFALTSESEGFPNVLIEAMALGVPVVSVDCRTGPSEIIRPGETGLLVGERDPEALAAALVEAGTDPGLRERLIPAGREFAARFTLERVLPQYEDLFTPGPEGGTP